MFGWLRHWIDERLFRITCFASDHLPQWVAEEFVVDLAAEAAVKFHKRAPDVTIQDLYATLASRREDTTP